MEILILHGSLRLVGVKQVEQLLEGLFMHGLVSLWGFEGFG
jgi:hypothetical protein